MDSYTLAPIHSLGECQFESPLLDLARREHLPTAFIEEDTVLPLRILNQPGLGEDEPFAFELAGPRARIFFDPAQTKVALVTCGGLCPGLNNVIRSVVYELYHRYGVQHIFGVRYGYHGLNPSHGFPLQALDAEMVSDIHEVGGTILGTSRGPESPAVMLETLRAQGIQILFTLGGDGTQRGALALHEEAVRQGYPLAVVGIPKTIDNDIRYVSRTFGFSTAVEEACSVINGSHTEARAVLNGIGLVKLMGRDSGFIAASSAIASGAANYVFIPEIPFELEGECGLLAELERRLTRKKHAVIVVAEGAGQHLIPTAGQERDASGNVKHADIGLFLRDRIRAHFEGLGQPINVRYIDPSYTIRSQKANTEDAILCDRLARHAVHAAMAGRSGLIIGFLYDHFMHVPTSMAVSGRKKVNEGGSLWAAVLASTGQPHHFGIH